MSFIAAGAMVVSSLIGADAAGSAAETGAAASRDATKAQERMFERQVQLQEPWRLAGEKALGQLTSGIEPGGEFTRNFSMADYTADPGYAFRLNEGIKALDRSAAARGGLLSGAQLKGITDYGQNMASQEYQNAFNRYQINRANRLQPLQSLAGIGQTSANTLSGAAGQLGQNIGNNLISAANARASGYMGQANALSSGISSGLNYYQGQNMINALRPTTTTTTPNYGGWSIPEPTFS